MPQKPDAQAQYALLTTVEQAGVVQRALDLYSRIGMGQFEAIIDHPDVAARIAAVPGFTVENVTAPMAAFKRSFHNMPEGGFHGIHSMAIDESNRVAWDLQQVIRHRLSHDRADAEGAGPEDRHLVSFDTPRASSTMPLPTFSKVDAQTMEVSPRSKRIRVLAPSADRKLVPARSLEVGQIWQEGGDNPVFAREIVEMFHAGGASIRWRRPGSSKSTWCDLRRFQHWILKTRAAIKKV